MSTIISFDEHDVDFSKPVMIVGNPKDLRWLAERLARAGEERAKLTSWTATHIQTDDGWQHDHEEYTRQAEDSVLARAREIEAKRAGGI